MSKEALNNLAGIGKLKIEPPARSEFEGLLRSGQHRLNDAEIAALSLESRFDLAYNAAHAFALAALRWHGYRSEWESLLQASGTAEGFASKYGDPVQRNIESYLFFDRVVRLIMPAPRARTLGQLADAAPMPFPAGAGGAANTQLPSPQILPSGSE